MQLPAGAGSVQDQQKGFQFSLQPRLREVLLPGRLEWTASVRWESGQKAAGQSYCSEH